MHLAICVQTDEVRLAVPVALFTGPLAERAAKAAEAGADGLELMTVDPAALDAGAVAETLASHGLQAAAVGSGAIAFATGLTLLHGDAEIAARACRRLEELIEFAAAVAAPLVTIGSLRGRLAGAGPDGQARLAEILWTAAERAQHAGVRLALEPANRYELDFVNTAADGLAFLAQVAHPALGLLLDTFHVNIEERSWTEPFAAVQAAGKLWHVHVGDNNRLAPGQGLIDFPAIVATLRRTGYDGYLSAELLGRPDADTAALQTLSYLRPLLAVPRP